MNKIPVFDDFSNPTLYINTMADIVLNSKLKNSNIQPIEIELYFYHETLHPDDAAQRHSLQNRFNMIYFYRAGKGYNLRPDKRMGCGISFSEKDYTLAVLLRSIKYNDEIVFGPSKVAAFIYNKYTGCKFYEDNKKEKLDNIQKIESIRDILSLGHHKSDFKIFRSKRVGINIQKQYHTKLYRFISEPIFKEYKNRNDIIESFLQDKFNISLNEFRVMQESKKSNIKESLNKYFRSK